MNMEEFEVSPPKESWLKAAAPGIGVFLFIIIAIWYNNKKANYTEKNGVVTVAKVIESAGEGDVRIHIYYKGKIISDVVNINCYFCLGGYYFAKVRKDDPENYPLFYEEKPVPDCIIEHVKYFEGWNDFPTCDSLK
jgi:hypothetical protein